MAMIRILSLIAISSTLLVRTASGQTGGRDLYIAKCSACHAPNGSGSTTIGRSLRLNDIRPAIKSMTDEQLQQLILQGKGKMPAVKKRGDENVRSLTVFLRDLAAGNPNSGRAVAEAESQPLPQVDQVFRDKCSACHGQDGTGRTTIGKSLKIPDLTSAAVQNQSAEELLDVVRKGRGRMPAYGKPFNPVQLGQLVAYIGTLGKIGSAKDPAANSTSAGSVPPRPPSLSAAAMVQPDSSLAPKPAGNAALLNPPKELEKKIAAPRFSNVPAVRKAAKDGRQIYLARCSVCHSSDGSGRGTIGRSMRIPSLISPQVLGQSDEALANIISTGIGKMPPYKKKCSPQEIQLLVAFIRELEKRQ
jgi:mono/diheme cytochrome c family protein